MKKVEFYFDFLSPYVWLALRKLPEFINNNSVEVKLVPVLFAGLLNAHGTKGPAEVPAKRTYVWKDAARIAKIEGFQMQGPPAHPFNPLPSLRLCIAVPDDEQRLRLAVRLATAAWEEGGDISDTHVLQQCLVDVGLDAALISRLSDESIKKKLKENTDAAIQAGVFGVPTFRVDDEIFWGQDRIILVEKYLKDKLMIDTDKLTHMLARPRAADRNQG